jgi:predicted bacteriocin transport accessory protein
MNLKKIIIIIFSISFVILIATIVAFSFKKNYLEELNYEELKNKIGNKENFILYIGNKSCSHCKKFEPKFKKIISEYKIIVYKIDTATLTNDQYQELIVSNVGSVGTPTVTFFVEGEDQGSYHRINGEVSEDKVIEKLKDDGYIKD